MRKFLTPIMMIALFSVMGLGIAATDDPVVLIDEAPQGEVVEPDPNSSTEPGVVEGSEGTGEVDPYIIDDPDEVIPMEKNLDDIEPWYRSSEEGEVVNPCGEGIEVCIFTAAPAEQNSSDESSNDILKSMFGNGVDFTPKFDMTTVALSVGAMSVGLIIIAFVDYVKANKKH